MSVTAFLEFCNRYGNLASVVGLAASLVGFLLTIYNTLRARRAAENAERAANEAIARVARQLFEDDIGTALRLMQEGREACRKRRWSRAWDKCYAARTRLAKVRRHRSLEAGEESRIQDCIDDLGLIVRRFETFENSGRPRDTTSRDKQTLDEIVEFLSNIVGRLRDESLEL